MIKLFLELGFQEEYAEMSSEISSLVDDLVEQALEETKDTGKCCTTFPGGGWGTKEAEDRSDEKEI